MYVLRSKNILYYAASGAVGYITLRGSFVKVEARRVDECSEQNGFGTGLYIATIFVMNAIKALSSRPRHR